MLASPDIKKYSSEDEALQADYTAIHNVFGSTLEEFNKRRLPWGEEKPLSVPSSILELAVERQKAGLLPPYLLKLVVFEAMRKHLLERQENEGDEGGWVDEAFRIQTAITNAPNLPLTIVDKQRAVAQDFDTIYQLNKGTIEKKLHRAATKQERKLREKVSSILDDRTKYPNLKILATSLAYGPLGMIDTSNEDNPEISPGVVLRKKETELQGLLEKLVKGEVGKGSKQNLESAFLSKIIMDIKVGSLLDQYYWDLSRRSHSKNQARQETQE
jgi:hypothetical protein